MQKKSIDVVHDIIKKEKRKNLFVILGILPTIIFLVFVVVKFLENTEKKSTVDIIVTKGVITASVANIRNSPSTKDSEIIIKASKGETFSYLKDINEKWSQILSSKGDTLYVSRSVLAVSDYKESKSIIAVQKNFFQKTKNLVLLLAALLLWNIFIYILNRKRKVIYANFYFNEKTEEAHQSLKNGFKKFLLSNKRWLVSGSKDSADPRYSGGATSAITRKEIKLVLENKSLSPFLRSNVTIPYMVLDNQELFFFPEYILVRNISNRNLIEISYSSFKIFSLPVQFREYEEQPKDAEVLDYTFKYVNKDGSPDLRFSGNSKIPICKYRRYYFNSDKLSFQIMTSSGDALDEFQKAFLLFGAEKAFNFGNQSAKSSNEPQQKIQSLLNLSRDLSVKASGMFLSDEYLSIIKALSIQLSTLYTKLKNDEVLISSLDNLQSQDSKAILQYCILFDLGHLYQYLLNGDNPVCSQKTIGYAFAGINIIDPQASFLSFDKNNVERIFQEGKFVTVSEDLLKMIAQGNPLNLSKVFSSDKVAYNDIQLSLPAILKYNKSVYFDEYTTLIYRYATMLVKSDDLIDGLEEEKLRIIYDSITKPMVKAETLPVMQQQSNGTLEEALAELDALIGLDEVKNEINTLINFITIQKEREKMGLKTGNISYHCVFTGSPGTGKTTVARIISKIYKNLGVVNKGQLIETDRAGLVAEYSGQTAPKVDKVVQSALDGVLFVDEAYSLVGDVSDDYGREAVAALLKRMEDNRDRLAVIVAGYTVEMDKFLEANSGLQSRFNRFIFFPDYTPANMSEIFEFMAKKSEYKISQEALDKLAGLLEKLYAERTKDFGNARTVRNIFEKTIENQSNRIAKEKVLTKELLVTIVEEDIIFEVN